MSAKWERTSYTGIYRRGRRYVYVWRDVNGKQRNRSAKTLAEAKAERGRMVAAAADGERTTSSRVTFAEYAREWIDGYTGRTGRGVGEDTRADYRRALGLDDEGNALVVGAVAFFGRMRLTEIEPRDLRRYAASVAARKASRTGKPVARDTVRLALVPVKALLATAVEDGLIRANPAAGLRNLIPAADASVDERVKALTEAQLGALLVELPERWRPFFEFLSETGLRIGEAVEVRFGDVLPGGWLHVQRRFYRGRVGLPKGRKTRRVRLSAETARGLVALRNRHGASDGDLIFTGERGQRVDQSNVMSRVLKPAAVRAGVGAWVGFHTFRHTCATVLFRQGWNASQVQRFCGHSDPGFTLRRYIHLLDADLPEPNVLDAVRQRHNGSQNSAVGETGL